ncbi:MAG: helix-turn-helix transcriptional regulator [Anaerolineaceae bacterium]|nr:helix-turn-helix transcriptional regulator [Anaerolineaceae bacterium]
MDKPTHEDDITIGSRIREQRKILGLSLSELARRTDLTTSFLSQVERGLVSTSINSLRRISEALGVSILYFLNDSPRREPVVRAGNRMQLTLPGLSNIRYEVIATNLANKIEIILGHLEPGKTYLSRHLPSPTDECVYVLSGTLEVGLEHQDYTLYTGDSICFTGVILRHFRCISDEEVVFMVIVTPPIF